MPRKLVRLSIKETSGVDHPAHLREGWMVAKSADKDGMTANLDLLRSEETPSDVEISKEESPMPESQDDVVIVSDDATEEEVLKSLPESVRKAFEAREAKYAKIAEDADKALQKSAASEAAILEERAQRADEKAIIKASASWPHLNADPNYIGPALRRLAEFDDSLAEAVTKALDSANEIATQSAVFSEIGTAATPTSTDAYSQIEQLAKNLVAEGKEVSFEKAVVAVTMANSDLYTQHVAESR